MRLAYTAADFSFMVVVLGVMLIGAVVLLALIALILGSLGAAVFLAFRALAWAARTCRQVCRRPVPPPAVEMAAPAGAGEAAAKDGMPLLSKAAHMRPGPSGGPPPSGLPSTDDPEV